MSSGIPDNQIPIVVGITGHRAIREADSGALAESVRTELAKLQARCPCSPLVLLTSLAEGGDLLCAEAAASLGIPLIAALPMAKDEFERDFSPRALERFRAFCAGAEQVFVVPRTEAVPAEGGSRDDLYRQAGIYISAHSHLLLALWDGGPGTKAACGTAEAVGFSLDGAYSPAEGVPLRNAGNTAVIHVYTPRGDRSDEAAGTVHLLGDRDALRGMLDRTEEFNRLAGKTVSGKNTGLPEGAVSDAATRRMEQTSMTAGSLSKKNARLFHLFLALLAAASTVLTLAFLLYDEAQASWMILVCGAMLLAALLFQRLAARFACHRRYIEYRSLAECLRAQTYLRYAGSAVQVSTLLPWTQQTETVWIMNALAAFEIGPPPEAAHDICACWVERQRSYHQQAGLKTAGQLRLSERILRSALLLSIALYLAALLFELLCGGLIFRPRIAAADVELCRTVLKILLGLISAATLFTANYYGRMSLSRKLADHRKMERFYGKMSEQLQRRGQEEVLLELIAREELIENGNWFSYQRDNKPDFSLKPSAYFQSQAFPKKEFK